MRLATPWASRTTSCRSCSWFPWSRSQEPELRRLAQNYLTQMARVYKERGWDTKAYVYILDETTRTRRSCRAEQLRAPLHKADRATGARVKFFLTDDPRPRSLGGIKTANTFLYDDVDIWALRYYYFFGRIPAVRERKKAGKEIWWYSYTNDAVRRVPSFVIDKPHIDSRVWGWMMEEWNVDGILNWGFNRWGKPTTGDGWRDPYRNPLSLVKRHAEATATRCLVYPGYYPRYGLNDPTAPPVSSLRLEALRDGLEEREYLRLAKAQGASGRRSPTRPSLRSRGSRTRSSRRTCSTSPCTRRTTRRSTRRARRWRSSSRRSSHHSSAGGSAD